MFEVSAVYQEGSKEGMQLQILALQVACRGIAGDLCVCLPGEGWVLLVPQGANVPAARIEATEEPATASFGFPYEG